MASFGPPQPPDEGYSEHPLNPSSLANAGDMKALAGSSHPAHKWLSAQLPNMTTAQKTHLAVLLLNDLPTHVVADIVMGQLNPRLYINFVEALPPEICLKIFGYLDPTSLIHVAMCCHGWYELSVDRKLWEKLFYLEGWKAIMPEVEAAERQMNEGAPSAKHPRQIISTDEPLFKKRAFADIKISEEDQDSKMVDVDDASRDTEMPDVSHGGSLFGGPSSSSSSLKSPSALPDSGRSRDKGKGKAVAIQGETETFPSVEDGDSSSLPPSSLWIFDPVYGKYKISWRYLYTMRRRLEANWDRGRYVNFQLPHPEHVNEGHNECIYSLQYNAKYLVSGSRDKTIRIWDLKTRRLVRAALRGHTGSVLCLQFDSDPEEDLIVSGSSDSDVILWKFSTGKIIQRLERAHRESVLNVKFDKRILVTCSKDKTIKIFNRRPLKPGDVGYGDIDMAAVGPVPTAVTDYGYGSPYDGLPIKPAYTMIGCLEGHGAAVNAVQICGEEIVSASGDRHIKAWDWPNQICRRTFLGHNKGIACVQYDGRRIVSGSSDNEVKVFDRETGLEVASLRAHSNLVRTVQAGFGDLPDSVEDDLAEARAVDQDYFKAKEAGDLDSVEEARNRPQNAGSRRPEDITAYGATLPPGGGGGPYGRIVSGSYDQTIMIWRRDRDGVWKSQHVLRQEDGASAALRRRCSGSGTPVPTNAVPTPHSDLPTPVIGTPAIGTPGHGTPVIGTPVIGTPAVPGGPSRMPSFTPVEQSIQAGFTPQDTASHEHMIEEIMPQGPEALERALAAYPTIADYQAQVFAAIEREPSPATQTELRNVFNAHLTRTQLAGGPSRQPPATHSQPRPQRQSSGSDSGSGGSSSAAPAPAATSGATLAAPGGASSTSVRPSRAASVGMWRPPVPRTGTSPPPSAQSMARRGSYFSGGPSTNGPPAPPSAARVATLQGAARQPDSAQGTPVAGPSNTQLAPRQPRAPVRSWSVDQYRPSQPPPAQVAALAAGGPPAHQLQHQTHHTHNTHNHNTQTEGTNPARIFKLQFDARRIICCSQTSTIVGWDFCDGDEELEEASRFFGTVE